jgi:hypothetical protein
VDARTTLTGASGSAQLQVTNTNPAAGAVGLGVTSASSSPTGSVTNNSTGIGVSAISIGGSGVFAQSGGAAAAALAARNTGGGPAASFSVNAGIAPFKVSSQTKVAGLNADQLDGVDSTGLQRRVSGTCAAGTAVRGVNSDGSVSCQAVGTGAAAWGVATRTGTDPQTTSSTSFVDLTGASATINVPGPGNGLIVARFSAESQCSSINWCSVQILLDGVEMEPASGMDFRFGDSQGGNPAGAHAMDRSRVIGPGNHTVVVQYAVKVTGTFWLDDWSLTIERAPV